MYPRILYTVVILLAVFILSPELNAQTAQKDVKYKGITLSPAIQNIELAPNQPRTTFRILVRNNQPQVINLNIETLDFKSLNDSGGVAFLGQGGNDLQYKYGLANWLIVPKEILSLQPNTSEEIEVVIDNRQDLSPGGHYAAVLFKNASSLVETGNRVSFDQVIATLVFMKKTGGEIYSVQMDKPALKTSVFRLPSSLALYFKNNGNTQAIPRGTVSIYGPNGNMYKKGLINPDSGLVLPESKRFYRTSLFTTSTAWLPGNYKVVFTYKAEGNQETQTEEYKLFYISPLSVLLVVSFIAAAFLLPKLNASKRRKKYLQTNRRHRL